MIDLDRRIKYILREKGKNFVWLAEQIGYSRQGLKTSLVNKTIKYEALVKIAEVLSVSIEVFFTETEIEINVVHEFIENYLSVISLKRYNKTSDKLLLLKDLYVAEVINKVNKGIKLIYPISSNGSIEYLLDEENFSKLTSLVFVHHFIIDTPFSKLDTVIQKRIKTIDYIFEGFYYTIFSKNILNVNDFLNDGLVLDDETMYYWNQFNQLENTNSNIL